MPASSQPRTGVASRRPLRPGSKREPVRSTRGRRSEQARARTANGPSRRKALRRRWITLLSVVTVLGLGYVLLFGSLLAVESLRVLGTQTVPDEKVRAAASVRHGTPLARVDTAAVGSRVGELPAFSSVEVSRSWPSTLVIKVRERTPVAAVDVGVNYRLVDGAGVAFRTVAKKPSGLPTLKLTDAGRSGQQARAATTVLAALPKRLADRVVALEARTANNVRLTLDDGTKVIWGSAERSARKAKVLAALLTRPGTVYDVSSPALPTVS